VHNLSLDIAKLPVYARQLVMLPCYVTLRYAMLCCHVTCYDAMLLKAARYGVMLGVATMLNDFL
jgi:hypothetical protein